MWRKDLSRQSISEMFKAMTLECLSEELGLEDEPE